MNLKATQNIVCFSFSFLSRVPQPFVLCLILFSEKKLSKIESVLKFQWLTILSTHSISDKHIRDPLPNSQIRESHSTLVSYDQGWSIRVAMAQRVTEKRNACLSRGFFPTIHCCTIYFTVLNCGKFIVGLLTCQNTCWSSALYSLQRNFAFLM